jgi:hypothetical protein
MIRPIPIVFLDIDGVLNDAQYWLKYAANRDAFITRFGRTKPGDGVEIEKLERLKLILRETGARLVIISSWAINATKNLSDIENTIDWPIYGAIDHPGGGIGRSLSIKKWLYNNDFPAFVILDDAGEACYPLQDTYLWDHMIHCDGKVGLTQQDAEQAIIKLRTFYDTKNINQ